MRRILFRLSFLLSSPWRTLWVPHRQALAAGCCLRPADRPAPYLTIDDLVALAASEYVAATQIMPTRDQTMIPIKTPIIARAL